MRKICLSAPWSVPGGREPRLEFGRGSPLFRSEVAGTTGLDPATSAVTHSDEKDLFVRSLERAGGAGAPVGVWSREPVVQIGGSGDDGARPRDLCRDTQR